MLRLSTAVTVADLLWPTFAERHGVIFLDTVVTSDLPPGRFRSTTEYERFHSHTHIQDLFHWTVSEIRDAELDIERPDGTSQEFGAAWDLAKRIATMWLAKLCRDFPLFEFRVYATKLDDPIIHFHRVRSEERPWIDDVDAVEQIDRDELLVLDSTRDFKSRNGAG